MTASEFHDRMLFLLRRKPFVPFEVELAEGQRFLIENPETVATNGGGAIFGSPSGDIIIFDYTDTRRLGTDVAPASAG
jgi:hypothetical protein